ncbi:uncharacterized protein BT62DRAFT_1003475 [Guyanagaster necrorhizus]|uniref:Uncharacterized protein n=1 Tax=Guyanagaster necrorhizus TaxID=856835 RepID=A0A9P8AWB1_9AGAR|nr:uncharacterized protein BT62DRAFT_1003475 [Guyanagaster necrorhizus MCA 3950]KAG7448762.1 hypothetical protein BT62DRAFT_1003475 [Guyanagaster necrorhizus MCA 3950]
MSILQSVDKAFFRRTHPLSGLQSLSFLSPCLAFEVSELCLHRSSYIRTNVLTYDELEKAVPILSLAQLLKKLLLSVFTITPETVCSSPYKRPSTIWKICVKCPRKFTQKLQYVTGREGDNSAHANDRLAKATPSNFGTEKIDATEARSGVVINLDRYVKASYTTPTSTLVPISFAWNMKLHNFIRYPSDLEIPSD